MDFPFPLQIDFSTSILALNAEYRLREVLSYSLEPTRNGRAAWPFQGQQRYCPFQGQAAPPPRALQLKR